MTSVSTWVLSVAGICVLGVLVELMLPAGQTKKYIKGIFSFVVVLIVISPLPALFKKDFKAEDIFEENAIVIQEDFVYEINNKRLEKLEKLIETDLNDIGFLNANVKLNANIFTIDLKIDAVFVDLRNAVIDEKIQHIDIEEDVKTSVLKYVNVERKDVIVERWNGK